MNVLIAVDFSPVTEAMLEAVSGLLATPDGKAPHFYLLHVAEPDPDFVGWDAGPEVLRGQMAEEFHREHRQLADLAGRLGESSTTTSVTPLLVQGSTVETVLEQAARLDASAIVVGSHGRGATYDLLIGSVSSGIVRGSSVPVLVVPSPDRS